MKSSPGGTGLILDACVLIDFIKAERDVLQSIGKHVGPLYVVNEVADEVNEVEEEQDLLDLGITILEPDIEDAYSAAASSGGTISFQDRLCLLSARRYDWTCVTNDKNLRKQCEREGISILWGLQLLEILHSKGGISTREVIDIARTINRQNPRHITGKIIDRFIENIRFQHCCSYRGG